MAGQNPALSLWKRISNLPFGRQLFSRFICFKAPYFGSIHPRFEVLEPGRCRIRVAKRRRVLNHIGSVHAIAMCNVAELAAGTMTEVTIPRQKRWIPKGMTVEYLQKAMSSVTAVATPDTASDANRNGEYLVNVAVADEQGQEVFRARITMWLSDKKRAAAPN